jgi:predicted amidophosphoribosyltransferase
MLFSLCSVCRLPSNRVFSALPCGECLESILESPKICRNCLGLTCSSDQCSREWMRVSGEGDQLRFESIHSLYLSIGPGAMVLKSWKRSSSPSLDSYFSTSIRDRLKDFNPSETPLLIIPVPQSEDRRWELDGGSTLRLARLIARNSFAPVKIIDALEVDHSRSTGASQAKSKGEQRYRRRHGFKNKTPSSRTSEGKRIRDWFSDHPSSRLVLVDDFLTSGATLRACLAELRAEPSGLFRGRGVHAFVLGFRPTLFG